MLHPKQGVERINRHLQNTIPRWSHESLSPSYIYIQIKMKVDAHSQDKDYK